MDSQAENRRTGSASRSGRRKSFIGVLLALLALAAMGWLAWHLTHQSSQGGAGSAGRRGGPPPTTVGVASVERTDLPVTVEALGTVMAAATATVRPQVSGVLKEVHFHEGQMVKAGQELALIDPRQFEMTLMQASGQRQREEAQLENAKLVLERYRTLLSQDSIARQDVETQAALVKQLEGTVISDRASEGTARLNLGYTKVTAPISGRVGLRVVDIGNVVGPNDANGIVVITQTEPIDVEFAVPQDRIGELRARINEDAKMPVTALDRTRSVELETGRFLAMDNQVDVQTGTVKAKARFANSKHSLFPSQFVNVRLLVRQIEGAILVPINALRHGNSGDYVYVLNAAERTVAQRPVTRGAVAGDKVQIVSGLNAGEQVITEGADRLKDGAHVSLPGDRPAIGERGERGARQGGQGRNRAGAGNSSSPTPGESRGRQGAGAR